MARKNGSQKKQPEADSRSKTQSKDSAKQSSSEAKQNDTRDPSKPLEFKCAKKGCGAYLQSPPQEELRGNIVKVSCEKCKTENFLQYQCWACCTSLDGIDYRKKGVQGQCPECGAFNPAKQPRTKDSWEDTSNRCVDRFMFAFTAFIQPYCVYAQTMWIYPYILDNMDMRGSTLEKVLYGITLFVSAGTLFNYWSGVFTPIKLPKVPKREDLRLKSDPDSKDKLSVAKYHYCSECKAPRAPRDHHCSICRTCVPVMDHHCPFYGGSCVGRHNHRNFILFLLFMMLTTVWLATSTVINFKHLPSFPSFIFKREFSKKIMTACAGGTPLCPLTYLWSFPEVSMFGIVVIQLLLTVLTLILVSVLFQQQVADLMESRTRLEGIIAKSKKKKAAAAAAAAGKSADDADEGENKILAVHDDDDEEASKWGELRDVCGPGHGLVAWIFTPYIGTLPSKIPLKKKKTL